MPADDDKKTPHDPVDDLKKGFGLLFRAAKSAVEQLPTEKLEQVVVTGVKEVGRAIENVTDQLDRQVFGGKGTVPHPPEREGKPGAAPVDSDAAPAPADGGSPGAKDDAAAPKTNAKATDAPAPTDEPPKGPRVA